MVRRVGVGTRLRRTLAPKAACAATAPARLDLACPRQRATSAAHPAKPACGDIPAAAEPLPVDRVLEATLPGIDRIDFTDRCERPNNSVWLKALNGRIGAPRWDTRAIAGISLQGWVGQAALIDIRGQIAPTAWPLALYLRAKATDLALAALAARTGLRGGRRQPRLDPTGVAQPVHPPSRAAHLWPLESWGNAPIIIASTQHQRVLAADPAPLATRFTSMRWDADMVLAALADVKSP